jgi:hypothetical protein
MSVPSRTLKPRHPRRRWRSQNGLLVPTGEAVAEALEAVPAGMPWTWAALRVLPTVRGERVQVIDDDELEGLGFRPLSDFPTLEMDPGIAVAFALDLEVAWITIDQQQLDRWEMTIEQVAMAAVANLRRLAGSWEGGVQIEDYQKIPVRTLEGWPYWASSLLLLPDELKRIFGAHDQLFVAPYMCNLVSLPGDVDRDLAADLVDVFGFVNPRSLLLGLPAFLLRDGKLHTEDLPGFPDLPEEDELGVDWLD